MAYILPSVWARVERLYFEGELRLGEIAAQCRISRASITKRARARDWPRHNTLELDGAYSERARLRRTIVKKITHLEARMDQPDTTSAADSERQSKEYSSLVGTVEKLDAKESAWRKSLGSPKPGAGTAPLDTAADDLGDDNVEQWRAELAQRIARLSAKWDQ